MDENNELLIVYKKNTMVSHYLKKLFEGPGDFMRNGIINRDVLCDTVGQYNVIFSNVTDIQKITDQLTKECLGYSVSRDDIGEINEPETNQDDKKNNTLQSDINML